MNKKYFLFALLLTFTLSCEDIVDIDPEYTLSADTFFNNEAEYEQALIGAYDLLQTSYLTLWLGEIASDNAIAGGESVNDTRGLHEIDEMTHNALNAELRSLMSYCYAGIARTNYLFENRNKLEFDRKEELYAEASFLRAYYYFELVKVFGGMPIVPERALGIEEAQSIGRSSTEEVYAQIESDLINASEGLPLTAWQKGRPTKGAALSLLGRAYLYQDKFDEAATVLDEVISSGMYTLINVSTSEEFSGLFSVAQEDNSESVFEIQYSGAEGGGYGCFVCLEGNLAPGFHGIRQYDGAVYGDGNSYNLPTQNLYDAFDASDIRRDGSVLDIDAFVAVQGGSYAEGGGGHTGYYNNKYIKRQGETGLPDDDLTSPVNHRVIRYPDVLLMAAEAHNRKAAANDATALDYLNQVRTRVGMPELSLSGSDLTNAIWDERRFELSGEGFRFFDLVRTGQAAAAVTGFETGKHELFPIPQVEIDLAGGNWPQNPGY